MADKEVNIDIKVKGIGELRKEMKATQEAIMNATDPEQAAALSTKLGEMKDRFADINEQAAIFATGNKFEQVSNSLGQIGGALMSLDFEKAAARAQSFGIAAGKITFKDAISSFVNLFKTMMTMGKALLTNPIFIVGAVIALVVKVVYELMQELGLLTKVMDLLKIPMQWITDILKSWINLFTGNSLVIREEAQKIVDAYESTAKAMEKASTSIISDLDHQIRMARVNGEETIELERKKLIAIQEVAKARWKADFAAQQAAKLNKKLTKEEIEEINNKAEASRQAYKATLQDSQYFEAQVTANFNKEEEDKTKKAADEAKKRADERKAIAQAAARDLLNLERQLEDEIINVKEDGLTKDLEIIQIKLERQLEDLETTKYTEEQKAAIRAQYNAIAAEQSNEAKKREEKRIEELNAKELEDTKRAQQELFNLKLKYNNDEFEVRQLTAQQQYASELELLKKNFEDKLISKAEYLEAERLLEEGYASTLTEIEKDKQQVIIDLEKEKAEERKAIQESIFAAIEMGMNSITSLMEASIEREIAAAEGNEVKQEQIRKKGFEQNKKMQIAQATMSGIQGVINALTAQSVVPEPMGSVLKGVTAALIGVSTAANISKIKSTQYGGGGGGKAAVPSIAPPNVERAMPNINFGERNTNRNNIDLGGNNSNKTVIEVNASISADQMTEVQNKNKNLAEVNQI